jgi:hypothetical protein
MQLDRYYTVKGKLYRENAAGDIYVWVNHPGRSGLGELDGFFSRIHKRVKKVVKKAIKAPFVLRKKVLKAVTKSKFGRTALRVAGAAFAPFTGGLSLAAAEAAARYGKTRYQLGLSRSEAFRKGAVGAAIGYVGGKGIQFGYSALMKPAAAAALPGYAGGGFTPAGYAGPGAVSAASGAPVTFIPGVGNVVTGVGGTLKTIGGALATGLKTLTGALPLLQASGVLGKKGEQAPSGEYYDPYAPAPAPFESMYGSGGGGGGAFGPGAMSPYDQEGEAEAVGSPETQQKQLAIGGAIALAGLFFFTTMKPKRGQR